MTSKEWNELVDSYRVTGTMQDDPGNLEQLDDFQKFWVNETKKSIKRTK